MTDHILSSILEGVRQVVREEIAAALSPSDDRVLTKREAAALLQVSQQTLMRKVLRREIKKLPGSPPRFLKSELEKRR
jgi:hypothetical protein